MDTTPYNSDVPSSAATRSLSPAPAAQRLGQDVDSGAPPSNTAPATCNGDCIHVLHSGIDSLYLSYPGSLSFESNVILTALKEAARSSVPSDKEEAVYPVNGHHFEVKEVGRGRFPFVLVDNAYRLEFSGMGAKKLPLALVQIRSEWLLSKGVLPVYEELSQLITKFGYVDYVDGEALVSRADLCVDFISDIPLDTLSTAAWVSRARRVLMHTLDRGCTGWSIGLGGDLSARLYDKTIQIIETGNAYMHQIWREQGWDGKQTVWRIEFQFRRSSLTVHGVNGVKSLLNLLGPLWSYATGSWLRLTIPSDTDKTQSRWTTHPVWDAISRAPWIGSGVGLSIPARSNNVPSDRYFCENALAWLPSFMAVHGIIGSREAFDRYYEAVKQYHDARCHITGHDFEGYLRHKAALKARRYNVSYPGIEERTHKRLINASANAYRRLKDGE